MDNLIERFTWPRPNRKLSLEDLPRYLTIYEICDLMASESENVLRGKMYSNGIQDPDLFRELKEELEKIYYYRSILCEQVQIKTLPARIPEHPKPLTAGVDGKPPLSNCIHAVVDRDDFKAWLVQEKSWPLKNVPLIRWFGIDKPPTRKQSQKQHAWKEVFELRDNMLTGGNTLDEIADAPEVARIFRKYDVKLPALSYLRKKLQGPGKPGAPKKS